MWIDAKQTLSASVIKIRLIIIWKKSNRWALHMRLSTFARSQESFIESEYAPQMKEWKGAKASDFDYLEYFIKKDTNWD
ncbi:hypothetical protein NXX22_26495, partial [Bacteroides thetaiotaomicron]|nr:hypothetical protein [Bacteroides thetaiotaomicron]